MGAVDIDPTSVFGVRPAEMDRLNDRIKAQHNSMMPLQEKSVSSPSFNFSHDHQTPKPLQSLHLGTPASTTSSLPQTSLFQTAQKSSGVTPNQLQFETPNLTPIPTVQDNSFVVGPTATSTDFVDLTNPNTIRRAKQVAARLYYQPSPETPISSQRDPSRYFHGRSAVLFSDDSISETPLRRGGRPSELSTARKPRALFLSENKQTINDKPQDENDNFGGDDQQGSMDENEQEQDKQKQMETPALTKESSAVTEEMKEEEIMNHHNNVEKVLELLCLLGAGYWRLCQVSTESILRNRVKKKGILIFNFFLSHQ